MTIKLEHRHFKLLAQIVNVIGDMRCSELPRIEAEARRVNPTKAFAALVEDIKAIMLAKEPAAGRLDRVVELVRHSNPAFDRVRFLSACRGEPINGRDRK